MNPLTEMPQIVAKGILGYPLGWMAATKPFSSPVLDLDGVRYNLHPCTLAESELVSGRPNVLGVPANAWVAGIRWTERIPYLTPEETIVKLTNTLAEYRTALEEIEEIAKDNHDLDANDKPNAFMHISTIIDVAFRRT